MTKIVEVWAKGYADNSGIDILLIDDDADPVVAAKTEFGPSAKVYSVRPAKRPATTPPVSEAVIRMMRGDNS